MPRMNPDFKLTVVEQGVLTGTRQLLGPHLADYLLSGMGEAQATHCRAFVTHDASPGNDRVTYRFEMGSDSAQGLPTGRDPIVMAALISLLRERQLMDDAVAFDVGSMLDTLGWPRNKESHLALLRAVERYAGTTYCLIDHPLPEGEGAGSYFRRLVISYETVSKPAAAKVKVPETAVRVQFWPYFVNSFVLARKSFLGVEFHTCGGLRRYPRRRLSGDDASRSQ
jgi:hypothetical protein